MGIDVTRTPNGTANIPELVLDDTQSASGTGLLAHTTQILRLSTTGGLAPNDTCQPGTQAKVPYGADYIVLGQGLTKGTPVPSPWQALPGRRGAQSSRPRRRPPRRGTPARPARDKRPAAQGARAAGRPCVRERVAGCAADRRGDQARNHGTRPTRPVRRRADGRCHFARGKGP
ncbi:DUF3455 domain-containing protein [Nonomuraea polychroma]|uniref:DUF3455 domain-containing protein n=1 Tax=Nonomuraea polychroma TaxID=46176 RepID=UPI0013E348B1|nr:DUF3455 domain-containing protein [Nonomuraea polychroma]